MKTMLPNIKEDAYGLRPKTVTLTPGWIGYLEVGSALLATVYAKETGEYLGDLGSIDGAADITTRSMPSVGTVAEGSRLGGDGFRLYVFDFLNGQTHTHEIATGRKAGDPGLLGNWIYWLEWPLGVDDRQPLPVALRRAFTDFSVVETLSEHDFLPNAQVDVGPWGRFGERGFDFVELPAPTAVMWMSWADPNLEQEAWERIGLDGNGTPLQRSASSFEPPETGPGAGLALPGGTCLRTADSSGGLAGRIQVWSGDVEDPYDTWADGPRGHDIALSKFREEVFVAEFGETSIVVDGEEMFLEGARIVLYDRGTSSQVDQITLYGHPDNHPFAGIHRLEENLS